MFTTILTHPGGAHKDDFLACCLVLAHQPDPGLARHPVPIERREPTDAELDNPAIAIVDIGHQHDPARSNFDHHQFPRDHEPTCSLSLVLQWMGLYEDARSFCEWLETAEWLDCRGPVDTCRWLGIERDILGKLNSPLDVTLLRRFAAATVHRPGEPLWEIMRWIGEDLINYLTQLRERLDFIDHHHQVWTIGTPEGSFKVLFMPRTDPQPEDASAGLGRYVEFLGEDSGVIGLIYPDGRGEGYGLRRYQDDPRLDFSRIEDCEDVHFAHARGFIAKTSTSEPSRLRQLMAQAYQSA